MGKSYIINNDEVELVINITQIDKLFNNSLSLKNVFLTVATQEDIDNIFTAVEEYEAGGGGISIDPYTILDKMPINSIILNPYGKVTFTCYPTYTTNSGSTTFTYNESEGKTGIIPIDDMSGFERITTTDTNYDLLVIKTDWSGLISKATSLTATGNYAPFYNHKNIIAAELDLSGMQGTLGGYSLFNGCNKLMFVRFTPNTTFENVTNTGSMFSGCSKLTSVDLSNATFENVTNTSSMFSSCSNLTSVDMSNATLENVTTTTNMFYGCSNLTDLKIKQLPISGIDFSSTKLSTESIKYIAEHTRYKNEDETFGTITFSDASIALVEDTSYFDLLIEKGYTITNYDKSKLNVIKGKTTSESFYFRYGSKSENYMKVYPENDNFKINIAKQLSVSGQTVINDSGCYELDLREAPNLNYLSSSAYVFNLENLKTLVANDFKVSSYMLGTSYKGDDSSFVCNNFSNSIGNYKSLSFNEITINGELSSAPKIITSKLKNIFINKLSGSCGGLLCSTRGYASNIESIVINDMSAVTSLGGSIGYNGAYMFTDEIYSSWSSFIYNEKCKNIKIAKLPYISGATTAMLRLDYFPYMSEESLNYIADNCGNNTNISVVFNYNASKYNSYQSCVDKLMDAGAKVAHTTSVQSSSYNYDKHS